MPMSWLHLFYWTLLAFATFYPVIFYPLFRYVIVPVLRRSFGLLEDEDFLILCKWPWSYIGGAVSVFLISFLAGFFPGFPFRRSPKVEENLDKHELVEHASSDFFNGSQGLISASSSVLTLSAPAKTRPKVPDRKTAGNSVASNQSICAYDYEEVHPQPDIQLLNRNLGLAGPGAGYEFVPERSDSSSNASTTLLLAQSNRNSLGETVVLRTNPFTSTFSKVNESGRMRVDLQTGKPVVVSGNHGEYRNSDSSRQFATVRRNSSKSGTDYPFANELEPEKRNSAEYNDRKKLKKVQAPKIIEKKEPRLVTLEEIRQLEENPDKSGVPCSDITMRRSAFISPYASSGVNSLIKSVRNSVRNSVRKSTHRSRGVATINAPEFQFLSLSSGSLDFLEAEDGDQQNMRQAKSDVDLANEMKLLSELNSTLSAEASSLKQREKNNSSGHVTRISIESPTPFTKF